MGSTRYGDSEMCAAQSPDGGTFLCTLVMDHDGPHVAEGRGSLVAAAWARCAVSDWQVLSASGLKAKADNSFAGTGGGAATRLVRPDYSASNAASR